METHLCAKCSAIDSRKPYRGPEQRSSDSGLIIVLFYKLSDSLELVARSAEEGQCDMCYLVLQAIRNAEDLDPDWEDSAELFDEFISPQYANNITVDFSRETENYFEQSMTSGDIDEPEGSVLISITFRNPRIDETISRCIDVGVQWTDPIVGGRRTVYGLSLVSGLNERLVRIQQMREKTSDDNTGSRFVFEMIREWMRKCVEEHGICRERRAANKSHLPTRVICVGDNETNLKLLCPTADTNEDYVCLSHCWGTSQHFKTETTSLKDRMASIAFSSMPKTFQDAVSITRSIGIKYLWIDSLCIIQDSEEDWNRESAQMGRIYRDASITIFAESADSDNGGCFAPYESRGNRLYRSPMFDDLISIFTRSAHGLSYIQARGRHKTWGGLWKEHLTVELGVFHHTSVYDPDLPLHQRGWVLQEQILSFRSLNYDKREVSWRCPDLRACECVPEGLPRFSHANMNYDKENALAHEWQQIVETFAGRELTFSKDTLPALAGVAKEFSGYWQTDYLAGLWRHKLREHLAWYVPHPVVSTDVRQTSRPSEFRSPSWSWASINTNFLRASAGANPKRHDDRHLRSDDLICDILDCWVKPRSPLSPFGEVQSGALFLRGRMALGKFGPRITETKLFKYFERTPILDLDSGSQVGWFDPDVYAERSSLDQVWCMPLIDDQRGVLQCLALTPFSGSCNGVNPAGLEQYQAHSSIRVYTRVGMIWGVVDHVIANSMATAVAGVWHFDQTAVEAGHHALLDWIEDADITTIMVV